MKQHKFICPKCNYRLYDIDEFRATGGIWTKIFNIQTKRFTTITCKRCFYTEIYRMKSSKFGNVMDFFAN